MRWALRIPLPTRSLPQRGPNMTAFKRKPGDSVQAGLAFNALRLLHHYDDLTAGLLPDEKYEATLSLSVLQLLLTNMSDLHERLSEVQAELVSTPLAELPGDWHLDPISVKSTFPGPVLLRGVVKHLRDAVSHPTAPRKGGSLGTGYTSPDDGDGLGLVESFRFVHSPWVHGKDVSRYAEPDDAVRVIDRFQSWMPKGGPAFELTVGQDRDGKYVVTHEDKPYVPKFEMKISVTDLTGFAKELANFIAQPIIPEWNGGPIRRLMFEPKLDGFPHHLTSAR